MTCIKYIINKLFRCNKAVVYFKRRFDELFSCKLLTKPKKKLATLSEHCEITDLDKMLQNVFSVKIVDIKSDSLKLNFTTQPNKRTLSWIPHELTLYYSETRKFIMSAKLEPDENLDLQKAVKMANERTNEKILCLIKELQNLMDQKINGKSIENNF